MALTTKLKDAFEVESLYGAFYTSGLIAWSADGEEVLCHNGGKINILSVETAKITKVIGEAQPDEIDEDIIYTFALSSNDELIVTAHKSGLLKLWSKSEGKMIKMWKGVHNGPISRLCFKDNRNIVASGGSDSSVRIWDHEKKTCLSVLKGSQGVVSVVQFHPDEQKDLVFGVADDNTINCWDYNTRDVKVRYTGHFSKVTAFSFTASADNLVSVSRDKVLILWDVEKGIQLKVIPLYETLEGVIVLPNIYKLPNGINLSSDENKKKIFAAVGGESGAVKIWNCTDCKLVYSQTNSRISKAEEEGGMAITQLLHCPNKSSLALVSADHNILFHNINTFHCSKQLIGFSDEILEICFVGKKDRYLAVATNSKDIKLYDTTTMNCQILKGHSDLVLGLASHKYNLLSCGKDNSIRVWEINPGDFSVKCVAKGTKHISSVISVTFGQLSHTICASVSEDRCLKVWSVPNKFEDTDTEVSLTCVHTQIAHEKDINCVTISPNDRVIATASQDKTAKLWSSDGLQPLGVLRGHRRGVWSVRFSPIDQIVLTASADCTMRLWSITDSTCLKSIEGHESSVLRAEFINKGMQILSGGADGLLKLWNIKNSECLTTLEKHEAKVWTLAISRDETHFFSGGADSQLICWKDVSQEKLAAQIQERQEVMLQEQELVNLIAQKKMLKALKLALRLEKPHLTLKIINTVIKDKEEGLETTVTALNNLHKESLFKHAINWNTNSRNTRPAQLVLNILIKEILANKFKPAGLSKHIEDSIPYTERHFKRVTETVKDLNFMAFALKCMQPHSKMDVAEK